MHAAEEAVPLQIKPLSIEHARQISDLHLCIWQLAYTPIFGQERLQYLPREESRKSWHERMLSEGYKGLGLWQQDRLIGFAGWGAVTPAIAEIYHFYLHPEFWGGRTAGKFMEILLEGIRQKAFQKVVLWVLKENRRAQGFYIKHGFEPAGQERKRYKWGLILEEVLFSRPVAPGNRVG